MRFLQPAFVGDVITPEFRSNLKQAVHGRQHRAVVELAVRLSNQAGEQILKGRHVYLLRRRPEI